jgi:nucleoside-diphosphate kinase
MSKLPSIEKTFVMVKPDGIKRGLVGKIFTRLENMGLKLVACRMILPTKEQAIGNYPGDNTEWLKKMGEKTIKNYENDLDAVKADLGTNDAMEIGKQVFDSLVNYITSGPVVLMVWEGNHAVSAVRKVAGETDPTQAEIGSIRGSFAFDTPMLAVKSGRIVFQTLLHISDSVEEAEREIKHWFGDKYKYLGDYERVDYVGSFEIFQ